MTPPETPDCNRDAPGVIGSSDLLAGSRCECGNRKRIGDVQCAECGRNYAASLLHDPNDDCRSHQSQLRPSENKFHRGNGDDGKHYWLTPPELHAQLNAEFGPFDFDPCPYPKPDGFDGLTCEWGQRNYVNPPFGSIMHEGKKKGPTAWMRKAILEQSKGKLSVVVYPVDKWVLMMLKATGAMNVRNLGDVRWHAIEDGSVGKGTGRHIAAFVLYPANE